MSKPKKQPTGKPSGSSHDRRVARRAKAGKKAKFKLSMSKEWALKAAEAEEGYDISAGLEPRFK